MVGEVWAVAIRLPSGLCAPSFAAGMRAEGLPCEPGRAEGVVYLPLCPSYSAEDVEHLVLGVAKVAHYLREALTPAPPLPRAGEGETGAGHDRRAPSALDENAGVATSVPGSGRDGEG